MGFPRLRVRWALLTTAALGALMVVVPPVLATAAVAPTALVPDPLALVNPFIGTAGGFNMFPGPDVPFGMLQWSPESNNRHNGGGYDHDDRQFRGFALTHMSGPGCNGYGDIPILPTTQGQPAGDPAAHLEALDHTNEQASPGFYSVLSGGGIRTELTSTTRTGSARFTYPAGTNAGVLIKLRDSQNSVDASSSQIVSNTEVSGSVTSGHFCGAGDQYTLFFDLVFDRAFTAQSAGGNAGVFLNFGNATNLQARLGISFVSVANARTNLAQENNNFNFDGVRSAARAMWTDKLNKIQIGGGTTSQQRLFYTALYHSLLHPNVVSDVNGQYMGFDKRVHTVSGAQRAQYGTYSGWDIYRTQAQLSALVAPMEMSDSAQSMINDANQNNGQLPKWATAGGESFVMAGDPGTAILSTYFAFGATSFDTADGLRVMLNEANNQNQVRPGLNLEKQRGYIPEDAPNPGCCNFNGSVGTLLEYNIADLALSRYAAAMGDTASADMLRARAQNWRNLLNPANKFMNPRRMDGSFIPVTATSFGPGYVEGTAAQYRFLVPFNQKGLTQALGGTAATNQLLDFFLSKVDPNDDDTAAMHNEVDIGMQYFYDWTGQPSKTQEAAHRVRMMFRDNPDTMGDNDDLGTMSASIVWQYLGMYPVTPGTADLVFNSPVFPEAVVHLPSGNTITSNAPGASESNFFVQSQMVNGSPSTRLFLPAAMLRTGATLDWVMGNRASAWGTGPDDAPPSYDAGNVPPPPPPPPPPGGNLALNRPATGSTSCNANEGPEKAFNGSVSGGNSDKWCSLAATKFLQVDLGSSTALTSFTVRHAGAGGESTAFNTRDFDIQVSDTGAAGSFRTVVQARGNTANVSTHDATASGRFVRLNVITPTQGGDTAARIYELEVRGNGNPNPPPPPPPPPGTNVALNKPATGSTPCDANEGPAKAFNGSVSGGNSDKFCSVQRNAFLQVDLGATMAVRSFTLRHAGAGGESNALDTRDYDIQVSTDGVTFTTVVQARGNTADVTTHTVNAGARFVKLVVLNGEQDGSATARIYDLEVIA